MHFIACTLPPREATVPASWPQEDSLVLRECHRLWREHPPRKWGAAHTACCSSFPSSESAQGPPALGLDREVTPLPLAALRMWQLSWVFGHRRPKPATSPPLTS